MIKTILKIVGIILGLLILVVIGIYFDNYVREVAPRNKVEISVAYQPDTCSKKNPMLVTIRNRSHRTIHKIYFWISVRREGHSSNLALSYSNYKTDKIIKPGKSFDRCWTYPTLEEEYKGKFNRKDLIYDIRSSIFFGD